MVEINQQYECLSPLGKPTGSIWKVVGIKKRKSEPDQLAKVTLIGPSATNSSPAKLELAAFALTGRFHLISHG